MKNIIWKWWSGHNDGFQTDAPQRCMWLLLTVLSAPILNIHALSVLDFLCFDYDDDDDVIICTPSFGSTVNKEPVAVSRI